MVLLDKQAWRHSQGSEDACIPLVWDADLAAGPVGWQTVKEGYDFRQKCQYSQPSVAPFSPVVIHMGRRKVGGEEREIARLLLQDA